MNSDRLSISESIVAPSLCAGILFGSWLLSPSKVCRRQQRRIPSRRRWQTTGVDWKWTGVDRWRAGIRGWRVRALALLEPGNAFESCIVKSCKACYPAAWRWVVSMLSAPAGFVNIQLACSIDCSWRSRILQKCQSTYRQLSVTRCRP
jgi:hypothetical protein